MEEYEIKLTRTSGHWTWILVEDNREIFYICDTELHFKDVNARLIEIFNLCEDETTNYLAA